MHLATLPIWFGICLSLEGTGGVQITATWKRHPLRDRISRYVSPGGYPWGDIAPGFLCGYGYRVLVSQTKGAGVCLIQSDIKHSCRIFLKCWIAADPRLSKPLLPYTANDSSRTGSALKDVRLSSTRAALRSRSRWASHWSFARICRARQRHSM